jgi:hypothetical protein
VNSLDTNLTEDVLNQLAIEDVLTEDFCNLSLNAVSGTDTGDCMKVRALVKSKVMLILVDSGSSHSFVSKSFLEALHIKPLSTQPRKVKLANGGIMVTDSWVPKMEWWANGHTLTANMKVLELGAYDAILGYDWLKPHSPMMCHWEDRTLQFVDQGKDIILQGVKPVDSMVQPAQIDLLTRKVHSMPNTQQAEQSWLHTCRERKM